MRPSRYSRITFSNMCFSNGRESDIVHVRPGIFSSRIVNLSLLINKHIKAIIAWWALFHQQESRWKRYDNSNSTVQNLIKCSRLYSQLLFKFQANLCHNRKCLNKLQFEMRLSITYLKFSTVLFLKKKKKKIQYFLWPSIG